MIDKNPPVVQDRAVIVTAMLFVGVAICVLVLYGLHGAHSDKVQPKDSDSAIPPVSVVLDEAFVRGDPGAHVGVMILSDFQCPVCGQFARGTLPGLIQSYVDPGLIFIAFRNYPLVAIHPFAAQAASAASCAAQQGMFWGFHDRLFELNSDLSTTGIMESAKKTGLELSKLGDCMRSRHGAPELADSADLGVSGTPTFLLGYRDNPRDFRAIRRLTGMRTLQDFKPVVEDLLKTAHRP